MAQLSDDCFAFGGPMMSVDEAVGIIAARVKKVEEIETVALGAADGRVLARAVAAPLPLPPFTNSAVDGYAVASRDLPQGEPKAFVVTGRIAAGASVVDPSLVQELVRARRRRDPLDVLSPREREVLALMAEGASNAGIARRIFVTEGTVEKHVRSILTKLDLPETGDDHRRVLAVITFLDSR